METYKLKQGLRPFVAKKLQNAKYSIVDWQEKGFNVDALQDEERKISATVRVGGRANAGDVTPAMDHYESLNRTDLYFTIQLSNIDYIATNKIDFNKLRDQIEQTVRHIKWD